MRRRALAPGEARRVRTPIVRPEAEARAEFLAELAATRGNLRAVSHRLGFCRGWLYVLVHRWGLWTELEAMRAARRRGIDPTWSST